MTRSSDKDETQKLGCNNENNEKLLCTRWKTGLKAFHNNVNKPALVLPNLTDQNNELSTPDRKVVVMNFSDEHTFSPTNDFNNIEGNFPPTFRPLTSKTTQILISTPILQQSPIKQLHQSIFQTSNKNPNRPKTEFSKTCGVSTPNNLFTPSNKINFSPLTKTQPIYAKRKSTGSQINNLHKSFNAHYNRQKQVIDRFTAHDWEISQRLHERKSNETRQRIKWPEFDPNSKVRFFTDNFETEKVVENARRERKMNGNSDGTFSYLEQRGKLPKSRGLIGTQQEHVFFWG